MSDEHLINLIYKAAVNDDWQSVAVELSQACGSIATHIFGHDMEVNKVKLAAYDGYDPHMLATYNEYYHTINSWIPGVSKSVVGKAKILQDFCALDTLIRSEFYNDWLRPQEEIGAGAGIVLFNDAKRFVILGGNIRFKDSEKKEKIWFDLLSRVGSHLRHAFEFQRVLQGEKLVSRGYLEVIEMIGNAVFLLDRKGRVQFQNKAAASFFSGTRIFYLDTSGALRLRDIRSDEVFRAGIQSISRKLLNAYQGVFPIRQPSTKRPLLAMLAPFVPDQDKTAIFSDFIDEKIPTAILTVHDRGGHGNSSRDVLAMMFGLTPSEIDLVLALCGGTTIQDYADQHSKSIHTVRNQLKSIFGKTETGRQAELVSVVGKLID